MKQYAKRFELKNKAKDNLSGKFRSAILMCVLASVIPSIIQSLAAMIFSSYMPSADNIDNPTAMTYSYVFSMALSLLVSIIVGVFEIGLMLFFLNIACDQPYSLKDLYFGFGFQSDVKKALTISGVLTLLSAVSFYPYQYLIEYFVLTAKMSYLIAGAVAFVIGWCIYVPCMLQLAIVIFLFLDYPEKSAMELLKLSARLMRGHKKRYLLLQLSFLPLMLLCVLSFNIGFLWLMPYVYMTEVYFFLDLMNPKEVAPEEVETA